MTDPDDALGWVFVTAIAMVALAFVVGLGLLIAWQVKESAAKQDCRVSGRRVVEDAKGQGWWCTPITPEKP